MASYTVNAVDAVANVQDVRRRRLLMLALFVTPITTPPGRGGAEQELMDPLKFEITFIVGTSITLSLSLCSSP